MDQDQNQSLLFRLPRELRDEIYGYYLREQGGYTFSLSAQKFRRSNGMPIELALGYICKRVAAEIHGYALRENTLRFNSLCQARPTVTKCSTADVFELLLKWRARCCRRMLAHAYWLVTVEAMREVRNRHPGNIAVAQLEQAIIEHGNWDLRRGFFGPVWTLDYHIEEVILHDLIQVIAKHPDFERLTSKEFDPDMDPGPPYTHAYTDSESSSSSSNLSDDDDDDDAIDDDDDASDDDDDDDSSSEIENSVARPPKYTKETQFRIIEWKPAFWWIPEQQDIDEVAKFLPTDREYTLRDAAGKEVKPRYSFSAAAATIRFLERLTPENRMHLRKITIQEDDRSVGLPQTHARGLVPFCIENPHLRIERRVDIWRTDFIPESEAFYTSHMVSVVANWICEAKYLPIMDVPSASFSLILHGPSEVASQQLCDAMIKAAIWHEGSKELARRKGQEWKDTYPLSEDFVDLMKAMVRGDIPARFEADMGEVWDIEEILRNHEGDWPEDARPFFALRRFEEPDGGWEAARAGYFEEVG